MGKGDISILLVESYFNAFWKIKSNLQQLGYHVNNAANLEQLMHTVQEHPPNLILMTTRIMTSRVDRRSGSNYVFGYDIRSGSNCVFGYDLCREIKESGPGIAIVGLVDRGDSHHEMYTKAWERHAEGFIYVHEACNPKTLDQRIEAVLKEPTSRQL